MTTTTFPLYEHTVRSKLEDLIARAFSPGFAKIFRPVFDPGAAAAVVPSLLDTFTDTNGIHVHDHQPDISPGSIKWTEAFIAGSTSAIISSNMAVVPAAATSQLTELMINSGLSNLILTVNYITENKDATNAFYINARYTNATNYWLFWIMAGGGTNNVRIYECTVGVYTIRAQATVTIVKNTTYTAIFTLNGTAISASINGTTISCTSSSHQTATKVGVWTVSNPTGEQSKVDLIQAIAP